LLEECNHYNTSAKVVEKVLPIDTLAPLSPVKNQFFTQLL